jgi:hypothetical protein
MTSTHTSLSICSSCGKSNDAVTHLDNKNLRPCEGDVSVCLSCNHVQIFKSDLTLRDPTSAEWDAMFKDLYFMRLIQFNARRLREKR